MLGLGLVVAVGLAIAATAGAGWWMIAVAKVRGGGRCAAFWRRLSQGVRYLFCERLCFLLEEGVVVTV